MITGVLFVLLLSNKIDKFNSCLVLSLPGIRCRAFLFSFTWRSIVYVNHWCEHLTGIQFSLKFLHGFFSSVFRFSWMTHKCYMIGSVWISPSSQTEADNFGSVLKNKSNPNSINMTTAVRFGSSSSPTGTVRFGS